MSFIQRPAIECNGTLSGEQSFLSTDVGSDTMQRSRRTAEEQLGLSSFKLCIFMTGILEESGHFWMFTLNKTDAMSHVLYNPQTRGCTSVVSASCSKKKRKKEKLFCFGSGGEKRETVKRKMMFHEHENK